jgi:hypothetical protein
MMRSVPFLVVEVSFLEMGLPFLGEEVPFLEMEAPSLVLKPSISGFGGLHSLAGRGNPCFEAKNGGCIIG